MITEQEKEAIGNIDNEDFYASILYLTLSRYHRIYKEAEYNHMELNAPDFVAIVDEAFTDFQEFVNEEND